MFKLPWSSNKETSNIVSLLEKKETIVLYFLIGVKVLWSFSKKIKKQVILNFKVLWSSNKKTSYINIWKRQNDYPLKLDYSLEGR